MRRSRRRELGLREFSEVLPRQRLGVAPRRRLDCPSSRSSADVSTGISSRPPPSRSGVARSGPGAGSRIAAGESECSGPAAGPQNASKARSKVSRSSCRCTSSVRSTLKTSSRRPISTCWRASTTSSMRPMCTSSPSRRSSRSKRSSRDSSASPRAGAHAPCAARAVARASRSAMRPPRIASTSSRAFSTTPIVSSIAASVT